MAETAAVLTGYVVVQWIVLAIGASEIGRSKNRASWAWFGLGLLFGPPMSFVVGFMAPGAPKTLAEVVGLPGR